MEKQAGMCPPETPLAECQNMVFLGTSIAGGAGCALVVATGMDTEVGHIATLLETASSAATPLQRRLDQVARRLLWACLGIVALVFAAKSEQDLIFLGLIGLQDPPRAEALDAVERCQRAGIRTVMITGDHPDTAGAIARELDILAPGDAVVVGRELDRMDDQVLAQRVPGIAVYARVTAEHKLRIVRAWKERGAVVAMTGDGVNDAPALKEASIGVAMGLTGTEVTKE